jgi:hypothetical protein
MKGEPDGVAIKMKGQLVFEFVIAAFILFAIVIYSINYMAISMNRYHERFLSNFLESRSLQISEVLMNDPVNGLVSRWPLLDMQKMDDFNRSCYTDDGYLDMLYNFSMIEDIPYTELHHLHVLVNATDGEEYVDCGRSPPQNITAMHYIASSATVTRFGYIPPPENKIAMIEVVVW